MRLGILICITSFVLLSGCATPYQPLDANGGYTELAYNKETYYVSFTPNGYTSHETAQNYLLRRAAEITLSKGYRYFIFTRSNTPLFFSSPGLLPGLFANSDGKLDGEILMLHSSDEYRNTFDAK